MVKTKKQRSCRLEKTSRWQPQSGFSLVELMVTMTILAIAAAIAIPNYLSNRPNMRLKEAARDLFTTMQRARIEAIKRNGNTAIYFDVPGSQYLLVSGGPDGAIDGLLGNIPQGDDILLSRVDLASIGSGVNYGIGNSTKDVPNVAWVPPASPVSYLGVPPRVIFNSQGTGSGGYVYQQNNVANTCYAVGSRTNGLVRILQWTGGAWD